MYKLKMFSWDEAPSAVLRLNPDGSQSCIPFDFANTDYQAYLQWIAKGNQPIPAEEPQ